MAKRLSRIERDIERLKEKISEYQQQLKELEAAKTEQENLQIIQLVTGVILTIAYIIRERKAAFDIFKSTRDFFGIILFAIFGVGLCQYAYLEAIHHTNAGIATALQYLAPVMVLLCKVCRELFRW